MADGPEYVLRYFFEWGGGCLWPGDDATSRDLDPGPYDSLEPCPLPLSAATLARCHDLSVWHDTALNWDYPPDPGPWRTAECDRFNAAAARLLEDVRAELGARFQVADHQPRLSEDPDLDAYLADPRGFRRMMM